MQGYSKYVILILLLTFMHSETAYTFPPLKQKKHTEVYFHDGKSVLDPDLRDNGIALDSVIALLNEIASDRTCRILAIRVEGNASPTGASTRNRHLTEERAAAVVNYLHSRITIPDSLIRTVADGVDWDGLASMVRQDSSVPLQTTVLDILDNTPVWIRDRKGDISDGRKKQLMDLSGGKIFRLLEKRFFADLRNVCIEIEYAPASIISPVQRITPPKDTSVIHKRLPFKSPRRPLPRVAVKTNLVYDAALMPSLEVEYRINRRWSVNLEGDIAWWKDDARHRYYQLATISPEGRYWFGMKDPWHGHYVGAFAGFSWYDLENGARGYKGEAGMAGLSYGYMFPVSKSLSFEAGIGIGYMLTEYEEYLPIDGHYVYQQTGRMGYFGPLKLKFALVWRIGGGSGKKGGVR